MKACTIPLALLVGTFIFPPAAAEKFLETYRDLRLVEEGASVSADALAGREWGTPAVDAAMGASQKLRPSASASAGVLASVRASWAQELQAMPEPLFFEKFTSEEFRDARRLARSADLDPALAKSTTLRLILAAAFERNPGLQARRESWRLAVERLGRAIYLDHFIEVSEPFAGVPEVAGPLPPRPQGTPGLLSLKRAVARNDVLIEAKKLEIAVRDLVTGIREAYAEYAYTGQALRITRENEELLADFERTARKKYENNQAAFNDVVKAQVRLSKLSQERITLQKNQATLAAQLNTLMNRPPDVPLGGPEETADAEIPLNHEELYASALAEQQDIQLAELQVVRLRIMTEIAGRFAVPQQGVTDGGVPTPAAVGDVEVELKKLETLGLQPSLRPDLWFGSPDAPLREMLRDLAVLEAERSAVQNEVRFAIRSAHFLVDAARRQRELFRASLLPQARQSLESTRVAYLSGKAGFLELLDAQRLWLDFNLSFHGFLRDYRLNLARLEKAMGRHLPSQVPTEPRPGGEGAGPTPPSK
ncbi:MAG: TolC family protein [Planctomycetes bacterium]|nr:TolC family protein [Planctomycetota bacterium]